MRRRSSARRPRWRRSRSRAAPARGARRRARGARARARGGAARMAGGARALCRGHPVLRGARARDRRGEPRRDALPHPPAEGRAAAHARVGRAHALPAPREPARRVPVHRGRVSVQARGRGPDAHVRGRGHARAHEPPLPPRVARACPRRGSRPRSTPSRSTGATRRRAPTSTARSATRASRCARSTTP